MKELLTEKELCERLGKHRNTIRNWRMMGCPYSGEERSYRYDPEQVELWLRYRDELMGGTDERVILDQKYLWTDSPEGKELQAKLDNFREMLPEEYQDNYEDLVWGFISDAFAAGYKTGMRYIK